MSSAGNGSTDANGTFALTMCETLVCAERRPFIWWIVPAVPMGFLVFELLWVLLSLINLIPSALAPWALSTTTLWIDKLCIDQTSDETKMAGVAGFPIFLGKCDKMVALISANYFSRLWCVFELAAFAKLHSHLSGTYWPGRRIKGGRVKSGHTYPSFGHF